MSISHWGLFPGYFVPVYGDGCFYSSEAMWVPCDFDWLWG